MVARNSVTTSSHYDRKRTDVTPRCLEKQDAQSIMGIAKHHGPSGRDAVEKSADFKILDSRSRCFENFSRIIGTGQNLRLSRCSKFAYPKHADNES